MSKLIETPNLIIQKYKSIDTSGCEIFLNCPGSFNKKEYQYEKIWDELSSSDNCLFIDLNKEGEYNIYSIFNSNGDLVEYRLVLSPELDQNYQEGENSHEDSKISYYGYLYVDPKLMICDPASYVNGETITLEILKKSQDDKEMALCDFGESIDNLSLLVYVYEVTDEDDEVSEYRLLISKEGVEKYYQMCGLKTEESLEESLEEIPEEEKKEESEEKKE